MAKQFTVTNKDGSTKTLSYSAKASKYARINNMTIPQIQAAKKILEQKMQSGEIEQNPTLKNKLVDVANQYEQTEREINKYYQKYSTDPRVKHLIVGKKNSLTIAKINQKDYPTKLTGKQEGLRYRKRDMVMDALTSKFALGVGITALGLGVAGQITSAVFGKSITSLLGELAKMMWANNPAALVAIGAGAALIAAHKGIPAIRNAVHNVQKKKYHLNQIQNALTEESEKGIDQFDAELLHENSFSDKKNQKTLINSMYNNPANVLASIGIQVPGGNLFKIQTTDEIQFVIDEIKYNQNLTPTQKENLITVVKEVAKKTNDASEHEKIEEEVEEIEDGPTEEENKRKAQELINSANEKLQHAKKEVEKISNEVTALEKVSPEDKLEKINAVIEKASRLSKYIDHVLFSANLAVETANKTNDGALKAEAEEILRQATAVKESLNKSLEKANEAKKQHEAEEAAREEETKKAEEAARGAVENAQTKVSAASEKLDAIQTLADVEPDKKGAAIDANIANATEAIKLADEVLAERATIEAQINALANEELKNGLLSDLEEVMKDAEAIKEDATKALEEANKEKESADKENEAIKEAEEKATKAVEAVSEKVNAAEAKKNEVKALDGLNPDERSATIDANIANATEAIKLADEVLNEKATLEAQINALTNTELKTQLAGKLDEAVKKATSVKEEATKALEEANKERASTDRANEIKAVEAEIAKADKEASEAFDMANKALEDAKVATKDDFEGVARVTSNTKDAKAKATSAIGAASKALQSAENVKDDALIAKAKDVLAKAKDAEIKADAAQKHIDKLNERENTNPGPGGPGYGGGYGPGFGGGYGPGFGGGYGPGFGGGYGPGPGYGGGYGPGYGGGGSTTVINNNNNFFGNGQPGQPIYPTQPIQPGQPAQGGGTTINNNGTIINGNVNIIVISGSFNSLTTQNPGRVTQLPPTGELPPSTVTQRPPVRPTKPPIQEEIAKNSAEQNIENLIVSLLRENNQLRTQANLQTESLIHTLDWNKILEKSQIVKLKPAEAAKVSGTIKKYIQNMTLEESRKLFAETGNQKRRSNGKLYTSQTAKYLASLDQAEIDKAITAKDKERDAIYAKNKEQMQVFNQYFPNIDLHKFIAATMNSKIFHERTRGHATPDLLSRGEKFQWKLVISQMLNKDPRFKDMPKEEIDMASQNMSNAIRTILQSMSLKDAKKIYKDVDPNYLKVEERPTPIPKQNPNNPELGGDKNPELGGGENPQLPAGEVKLLPPGDEKKKDDEPVVVIDGGDGTTGGGTGTATVKKTKEQYRQEALERAQKGSIMGNVQEFVRSVLMRSNLTLNQAGGNSPQDLIHNVDWEQAIKSSVTTKLTDEQVAKLASYATKYVETMTLEEARKLTQNTKRATQIDRDALATHLSSEDVKEDSFKQAIYRRNKKNAEITASTPADKEIDAAISQLLSVYNNSLQAQGKSTVDLIHEGAIDWDKAIAQLKASNPEMDAQQLEQLKEQINERIARMSLKDAKTIYQESTEREL